MNAIESLMDLRCEPRLPAEKSKNSSTHEGLWFVFGGEFSIEAILWCGKSGQLGAMFGTLGGNCAINVTIRYF